MKKYVFLFSILFSINLYSQNYVPSEENLKARKWFSDAKFGLFVHWGVYSILGDGEWVMNNKKTTLYLLFYIHQLTF